jgi:hypothetical protein
LYFGNFLLNSPTPFHFFMLSASTFPTNFCSFWASCHQERERGIISPLLWIIQMQKCFHHLIPNHSVTPYQTVWILKQLPSPLLLTTWLLKLFSLTSSPNHMVTKTLSPPFPRTRSL